MLLLIKFQIQDQFGEKLIKIFRIWPSEARLIRLNRGQPPPHTPPLNLAANYYRIFPIVYT